MTTSPASASPAPSRPSTRLLVGLFVLAWIPRLALTLVFLNLPLGLDDMYQYDMLALSISRGDGYRWYQRAYFRELEPYIRRYYETDITADQVPEKGLVSVFRPPGYPAFLAAIYLVVGEANRIAAARVVQSILAAALAPLTALLAAGLGLPRKAGGLAGGVVALYPILWMYPLGLASENLFLVLVPLSCLLLLRTGGDHRYISAIAAGAVVAAAVLTRGALVFFLLFSLVWLARSAGWSRAAAFGATAAVLLLPWVLRNSRIAGRPAFVENSVGYNLYVGYHPQGDGGFVAAVAREPTRFMDDVQRDRWSLEQALGFIRDDPARAASLLPRRLGYLVDFETREMLFFYSNDVFGPIPIAALVLALVVLILPWLAVATMAPFGLAAAPDRRGRDLVLLLVASTLLAYAPILAEPRFHLPLIPLLAPYAATVWLRPTRLAPSRFGGTAAGYRLAVAAVLVLAALWSWDAARQAPRIASVLAPGGNTVHLDY